VAVLARVAAACSLAACYSPDVADCVARCATDRDCATGHVCGDDRFCAAPEIAGRCEAQPLPMHADAAPTNADASSQMPDARPLVAIRLEIDGDGQVNISGGGTCNKGDSSAACTYHVPVGVAITLDAIPYTGQLFEKWASETCAGEPASCTFTPLVGTTAKAKFIHAD
jgi:hypothetical protein